MIVQETIGTTTPVATQDFLRHPLEVPEANLSGRYFPLGFPVQVRTNEPEVLACFDAASIPFQRRFHAPPIAIDVHVVDSDKEDCPPTPVHSIAPPLLIWSADPHNVAVADLERTTTQIVLTQAALRQRLYANYFFLEPAASAHICTRFCTPIHAACVALAGRGLLLCGESGAGKSTLSYACARSGWSYVSDDAALLLNDNPQRIALGNCYQVRFRPTATNLFPEIAGLPITPRAEGKPSIELPVSRLPLPHIAETAPVDFIVFLRRDGTCGAKLLPYSRDVARQSMRRTVFGTRPLLAAQYATIERLLAVDVYELHYSALAPAIARLEALAREDR